MSEADFYRAFEDRYRGSASLIEQRLSVYVPAVQEAAAQHPGAGVLDLGCGRGEWLELLHRSGVRGRGIDSDAGMLQACRDRGLDAELGDAIEALRRAPAQSLAVVTAFHFVEHIPFASLETLMAEAMRALCDGGLLILETPNPESPIVSTTDFYLDPTHTRPLPPKLLSFMAEFHGFRELKVVRLHERRDLRTNRASLWDVLSGTSPDYSIVARKGEPRAGETTSALDALPGGETLEGLALAYDERLAVSLAVSFAEMRANYGEVVAMAQDVRGLAEQTQRHAANVEARITQAHSLLEDAQWQLRQVYASTSWRVTAPLRWAGELVARLRGRGGPPTEAKPAAPPAPVNPPHPVTSAALAARAQRVLDEMERKS